MRPRPEAASGIKEITLDKEHPERTVQLGREMEASTRYSLLQEY